MDVDTPAACERRQRGQEQHFELLERKRKPDVAASAVDRFVDRVGAKPQRGECYLCDSSRHRCS
jgi:hypothetical protein